jgi:hypothetical protein
MKCESGLVCGMGRGTCSRVFWTVCVVTRARHTSAAFTAILEPTRSWALAHFLLEARLHHCGPTWIIGKIYNLALENSRVSAPFAPKRAPDRCSA